MAILTHRVLLSGLVAAMVTAQAAAQPSPVSLAYAVKANYLYKLAPFVEWPPSSFATAEANFKLCIVGSDPFGPALDGAVKGKTIRGHPIVVLRDPDRLPDAGCHVVFARGTVSQVDAAFGSALGKPILTVADEGAGVRKAMIRFIVREGRVRFQIDTGAVRASGLTISSKLLELSYDPRGSGR